MNDSGVIKATFFCTMALYLKFLITLSIQGGKSLNAGQRPPEDSSLPVAGTQQSFGLQEVDAHLKEQDVRWKRIVMNDLENLPFGLIIAWMAAFYGQNSTLQLVCVVLWTFARISYTFCYAYSIQPWRSYIWMAAIALVLIMGFNGLVGAFNLKV